MRRTDKEITDRLEQYEILSKGHIIRLAMALGNEPYVVPMSYGFKDGELYMHSALEGKKIDMLKKNPNVCFEVSIDTELLKRETSCGWTYCFRSVIGRGRAVFVTDITGKRKGLDIIMNHYGSTENSYKDEVLNKTVLIKIEIDELTGKKSPVSR